MKIVLPVNLFLWIFFNAGTNLEMFFVRVVQPSVCKLINAGMMREKNKRGALEKLGTSLFIS